MAAEKRTKIEDEIVIANAVKLTLWDTKTFKPIINHDYLTPIMVSLGFNPVPFLPSLPLAPSAPGGDKVYITQETWHNINKPTPSSSATPQDNNINKWVEYVFPGGRNSVSPAVAVPWPRMPYPRIDGLHETSYGAFMLGVGSYLKKTLADVNDIFHVRGVALDPVQDQRKVWLLMDEADVYAVRVYCQGTVDQEAYNYFLTEKLEKLAI